MGGWESPRKLNKVSTSCLVSEAPKVATQSIQVTFVVPELTTTTMMMMVRGGGAEER